MTPADIIYSRRCRVIERAAIVGVAQACREAGVSRTSYYRWTHRASRYGLSALVPKGRRRPAMPNGSPPTRRRSSWPRPSPVPPWAPAGSWSTWRSARSPGRPPGSTRCCHRRRGPVRPPPGDPGHRAARAAVPVRPRPKPNGPGGLARPPRELPPQPNRARPLRGGGPSPEQVLEDLDALVQPTDGVQVRSERGRRSGDQGVLGELGRTDPRPTEREASFWARVATGAESSEPAEKVTWASAVSGE